MTVEVVKRYLLFAGDNFYPSGGWDDLYSSADDVEALQANKSNWDWAHIVDSQTGEKIVTWYNHTKCWSVTY